MNKSLQALCQTLKKIIIQLKPQANALSLLLFIGKTGQGKSTLLRQSGMQHVTTDAEQSVDIYFNRHGILIKLNEPWINQSNHSLQNTLKHLNRCHRHLNINGIVLALDIRELLSFDARQITENCKAHAQLLQRFGKALGYRVDTAVFFTKLDGLAGFSEFFSHEHASELQKPLGFSLLNTTQKVKMIESFRKQFDQFIESLNQQVIHKMHPVRSSLKRTLIREFPLQLSSLRPAIQAFLQYFPPQRFSLQSIYFTSAEQGGKSHDRLNAKIKHEYALAVQDQYPQSINYRAYFIQHALRAFQKQTKHQLVNANLSQKWMIQALSGIVGLSVIWLGYHHIHTSKVLDEASKELLLYDSLSAETNHTAPALYHLAKASAALEKIHPDSTLSTLQNLKSSLKINTTQHIHGDFLPYVLTELEQTLIDPKQSQTSRYRTLKLYLMLSEPTRFSQTQLIQWFEKKWQDERPDARHKKLDLLKQTFQQPFQPVRINQNLVADIRNYMNALPASYLFYSLAKDHFPKRQDTLKADGFILAHPSLPFYYTKPGFQAIIQMIPNLSQQLRQENWVLARQDLKNLQETIQQAYCYDYAAWWQNFIKHSNPLHFQNYDQAQQLVQVLDQANTIQHMVDLVQQNTAPEYNAKSNLFNREIASQFTSVNLLSPSTVKELTATLSELGKFLTTLGVIHDHGQTAFMLTKARFQGDMLANPLSSLYLKTQQIPEPLAGWFKQVADDAWVLLMLEAKNYINEKWQETVFSNYTNQIAHRFPFDNQQAEEVDLKRFEQFFSRHGALNRFLENYLKPFLDTSQAQWQPKTLNHYIIPISSETIRQFIRANVITNMFFPGLSDRMNIDFSLQKISLDPVISTLKFSIGKTALQDDQNTESFTRFHWPQSNARLLLRSIEGNHYEIEEQGPWAFFKILQKVNVLVDEHDHTTLQILFEINGNSGRYALRTKNRINPFIPGMLNDFMLPQNVV